MLLIWLQFHALMLQNSTWSAYELGNKYSLIVCIKYIEFMRQSLGSGVRPDLTSHFHCFVLVALYL